MAEQELGSQIRSLRRQQGMTLDDLAGEAGLSKGYLSKLERGLKTPPISTLANIARALSVEIAEFFRTGVERPRLTLVRAGDRTRVRNVGANFGYFYESLADRFHEKKVEPFIITMTPGAKEHPLFSHRGQEMIFVLEGRMLFYFGQERHVCEPGDCLYFDASEEHRAECVGPDVARALVVVVPDPGAKGGAVGDIQERIARKRRVRRGTKAPDGQK